MRSNLISVDDAPGMRALMARHLSKLNPGFCIGDAPAPVVGGVADDSVYTSAVIPFAESGESATTANTRGVEVTYGEISKTDIPFPDEITSNTATTLVAQGLRQFSDTSDTESCSDTKQRMRQLRAELRQLEKDTADPVVAIENARLQDLVPDYWKRFLSTRLNEITGQHRYQFMFWEELDSVDWQDMKSLSVRNQWLNVKPHVQSNPVLASLIYSLGLRAFKTLLTGHSLGLIVQRLQRLLSHHLRISNQPVRAVIAPAADTNRIIQLQHAEIRELKLRAGQQVSYQSAVQACADWVNEADTELTRLNVTGSDTKPEPDTKRRGRQHDTIRDTLVMNLLIQEGKSKSEVARSLGVNEKVIRRIVQRYKEGHATHRRKQHD